MGVWHILRGFHEKVEVRYLVEDCTCSILVFPEIVLIRFAAFLRFVHLKFVIEHTVEEIVAKRNLAVFSTWVTPRFDGRAFIFVIAAFLLPLLWFLLWAASAIVVWRRVFFIFTEVCFVAIGTALDLDQEPSDHQILSAR